VSIQPLDVILFRGVDAVSHAICFFEGKVFGHGDFSHAGVAVTREVLDLPFLEPGRVYVWESTLSAPAGLYGHAPYTANLLDVFAVVFPALRSTRDRFDSAEDRMAYFMNHVLEKARAHKRLVDAEHHMFCSEWVAMVYKRLGLTRSDLDPRAIAPVEPLARRDLFAEPVLLEPAK